MWLKNQQVIIEKNKIIANQNYSTPGIYKTFNTIPNSIYKIYIKNLNKHNAKIKYWISDQKKQTLYFSETKINTYLIPNSIINIGILFFEVKLNEYFYIDDIQIEFIKKKTNNIQIKTSPSIIYFDKFIKRKYNFSPYKSTKNPTVFFGCYTKNDINIIKKHSGKKILLWGGTDVTKTKNLQIIKNTPNITHIAQSQYIIDDLNRYKIKCQYIPIAPTVNYNSFKPIKKCNGIYIYTNALNQKFYGKNLYNQVIKKFPNIPFYIASNPISLQSAKKKNLNINNIKSYNQNELKNIYSKCFISLRLTNHDGISATIQELGLMGIKTIHNGITPSCVKYKNINDIFNIIKNEMKTIGTIDYELSNKVKTYLQNGDRKFSSLI